jgi:signal transduction histidine kinase
LKLITKSTYYFLLFTIIVLVAGGMFLYTIIKSDLYNQIDNSLITEREIIQDQIEQTESVTDFSGTFGHQIEVKLLGRSTKETESIKDTTLYNAKSGENEDYRYYTYYGNIAGTKGYTINIYKTLIEKQDLLDAITIYLIGLFISLLGITILINYLISRKLWNPFYKSVEKALIFDVQSEDPINLPKTDIIEFQELNIVLERMTQKMRSDYLNLKEYNENAAHEIQTPLAIIRSKIELLLQNRYLTKESINQIKSIDDATNRLFKLNQGLLLISKIENQYFQENKKVSVKELLNSFFDNYSEILELKGISTEVKISGDPIVEMNETLADILISNLLSNAVRYNIEKGFIKCEVSDNSLTITNSGLPLKVDPQLLFKRFSKVSDNPQSVGLGLSIVKKIADTYGIKISYTCTESVHELKLLLPVL